MTSPLPPFSGDLPTCPKCSYIGAFTEHKAAEFYGHTRISEEYLLRRCERCDYEWREALNPPADTPEETTA